MKNTNEISAKDFEQCDMRLIHEPFPETHEVGPLPCRRACGGLDAGRENDAEEEIFKSLVTREYCYVKTAKLPAGCAVTTKVVAALRASGMLVAEVDLVELGTVRTPEQWYSEMIGQISNQLDLRSEIETYWRNHQRLSPVQRFFSAIQQVILTNLHDPIVVMLCHMDLTRHFPFAPDEFFSALRATYNQRTEDPELNRLRFCLIGNRWPEELTRNLLPTPFNVARRIRLEDCRAADPNTGDHNVFVDSVSKPSGNPVLNAPHKPSFITRRYSCCALAECCPGQVPLPELLLWKVKWISVLKAKLDYSNNYQNKLHWFKMTFFPRRMKSYSVCIRNL